jgi:hypothetical protein
MQPSYIKTPDYLKATNTAVFNSAGLATVIVKPDVGQYWFPTFMTVSTLSQLVPFASCTVYSGGPGLYTPSTYVDDTLFGYQDASSIVAGTMTQYGEQYTAVFTGGLPGDVATLTIFGVVAYATVGQGPIIPSVPGTQFRGHGVVTTKAFVDQGTFVIGTGGSFGFGSFDMRAFQTVMISSMLHIAGTTPAGYNGGALQMSWFDDQAFTVPTYHQAYMWGAQQFGTTRFGPGGSFDLQDTCHGNFLNIGLTGYGPDNLIMDYFRMRATSRVVGGPYAVESGNGSSTMQEDYQGQRGLLLADKRAIGAGITLLAESMMGVGQCQLSIRNAGAGTLSTTWQFGEENAAGDPATQTVVTAANTTSVLTMWVPNCPVVFTVVNTGASASTYVLYLVRETHPTN